MESITKKPSPHFLPASSSLTGWLKFLLVVDLAGTRWHGLCCGQRRNEELCATTPALSDPSLEYLRSPTPLVMHASRLKLADLSRGLLTPLLFAPVEARLSSIIAAVETYL